MNINYTKLSNYYSIFFSLALIYIIYNIKNIEQNLKICCYINICKSLNFVNGDIFNFFITL